MTEYTQPTDDPTLAPPIAEHTPKPQEPPALPDGFVCPEGTVPGWLNSDGHPTSCVGDLPNPGGELGIPQDVYPPQLPLDPLPELAPTGLEASDVLTLIVFAAMLIVVGWLAWKASRRY